MRETLPKTDTHKVTHAGHEELEQVDESKIEGEDLPNGLVQFIRVLLRRMQRVDIVVETYEHISLHSASESDVVYLPVR